MELIDTHCHLTTVDSNDMAAVIERAAECFVKRMVSIGASEGKESAKKSIEIAEKYPQIYSSVGIHPHDAGCATELGELEQLAEHEKVKAIGECGLDFFRDWAPVEDQRVLFKNTIAFARNIKKPLIIHCRDAAEETLKTLKDNSAEEVGGVFHCYAEDAEYAKILRDMNFLVSFTGTVTFKKAIDRREAVAGIPLEQIMLETDMPYMAPEPFRGKPSEPMHVYQIARKVAEVKGISLEEVAKITTNTAVEFFELD